MACGTVGLRAASLKFGVDSVETNHPRAPSEPERKDGMRASADALVASSWRASQTVEASPTASMKGAASIASAVGRSLAALRHSCRGGRCVVAAGLLVVVVEMRNAWEAR